MRRAVRHLQLLAFHEIAVRREKFHIKDFAEVGERTSSRACDVPLVPYRVAYEIASIVDMQIDFFLWQYVAEMCHTAGKGINARGVSFGRVLCRGRSTESGRQQR